MWTPSVLLLVAVCAINSAAESADSDGDVRALEWRLERLERTLQEFSDDFLPYTMGETFTKLETLLSTYHFLTDEQRVLEIQAAYLQILQLRNKLESTQDDWLQRLEPIQLELNELWKQFDYIINNYPNYNLKKCMENVNTLQKELETAKNESSSCCCDGDGGNGGGGGGGGGNGGGGNGGGRPNISSTGAIFKGFRGDDLPVGKASPDWCDKHTYSTFSYPLSHLFTGTQLWNSWQRDAAPRNESHRTEVFWRKTVSRTGTSFVRYDNYNDFAKYQAGVASKTFVAGYENSNFIVYDRSMLYYFKDNIYKVSANDMKTVKTVALSRASLGASDIMYYGQKTYNYQELMVDEFGIYIVYANKNRRNTLTVTQLDPETLQPVKSFHSNKRRDSVCASFMMCGRLYTLSDCKRRVLLGGQREYMFDTRTGMDHYVPAGIVSLYGLVDHLTYSPRDRLVFGNDKGHAIAYSVVGQEY